MGFRVPRRGGIRASKIEALTKARLDQISKPSLLKRYTETPKNSPTSRDIEKNKNTPTV